MTDAIYEVISGTYATITQQEFQLILRKNERVRKALHALMVLQGLEPGSALHRKVRGKLQDATKDWVQLKKVGRSYAMEEIVKAMRNAPKDEQFRLSEIAEDYQRARRGLESVHASYYLQVRSQIESHLNTGGHRCFEA